LPTAWASNYRCGDEASDEQGYDDDGDLFQICGIIILVVCSVSSAELFNMNNEVFRMYSAGLLLTVQEMQFCTYVLHIGNCAGSVA
jgi:hypothetical protein